MTHNPVVLRISLGLVALTCSILVGLDLAGLAPTPSDDRVDRRIQLLESLALPTTVAIEKSDFASMRSTLDIAVRRNEELMAAGLRTRSGRMIVATREHQRLWHPDNEKSTVTHARAPMYRRGKVWGELELRFADLPPTGIIDGIWERPALRMLVLVAGFGFITYMLYMRRVLRFIDPSTVIPPRVQAVLDVMAEGVLLLDRKERIVLANSAFAERIGSMGTSLLGVKASELGWNVPNSSTPASEMPWVRAIHDGESHEGVSLSFGTEDELRTFIVNSSPVSDGGKNIQGAIATFDDVTELEQKSKELERALAELGKSRDEIELQNEELQVLASSDPLTGLSNRRSFMEKFDREFENARRSDRELCCMMMDIDHFKRINDEYGHGVGDEVISAMARILMDEFGGRELVCRYGGEEFVALMVDTPLEQAMKVGERVRQAVVRTKVAPDPVTSSFGVASITSAALRPQQLIEHADQALYRSKESGRNRVTAWTPDLAD